MFESDGNNHQDYSKFDKLSTQALKDILQADAQLQNEKDSDVNAILYIMGVIAKRENENLAEQFTDVSTAWASFNENYLPFAGDKSIYDDDDDINIDININATRTRSTPFTNKKRLIYVAAVIFAVLFTGTFTTYALGYDIWETVAKWTQDTFKFTNASTEETDFPKMNSEYKSLQEALDDYGIDEALVPTWMPDGYSFKSVDIDETPAFTTFYAIYENQDGSISMSISYLLKPISSIYEKDEGEVITYTVNGNDYFIMTNLERRKIVWKINNYECSITGKFTKDDAKKMIVSIK